MIRIFLFLILISLSNFSYSQQIFKPLSSHTFKSNGSTGVTKFLKDSSGNVYVWGRGLNNLSIDNELVYQGCKDTISVCYINFMFLTKINHESGIAWTKIYSNNSNSGFKSDNNKNIWRYELDYGKSQLVFSKINIDDGSLSDKIYLTGPDFNYNSKTSIIVNNKVISLDITFLIRGKKFIDINNIQIPVNDSLMSTERIILNYNSENLSFIGYEKPLEIVRGYSIKQENRYKDYNFIIGSTTDSFVVIGSDSLLYNSSEKNHFLLIKDSLSQFLLKIESSSNYKILANDNLIAVIIQSSNGYLINYYNYAGVKLKANNISTSGFFFLKSTTLDSDNSILMATSFYKSAYVSSQYFTSFGSNYYLSDDEQGYFGANWEEENLQSNSDGLIWSVDYDEGVDVIQQIRGFDFNEIGFELMNTGYNDAVLFSSSSSNVSWGDIKLVNRNIPNYYVEDVHGYKSSGFFNNEVLHLVFFERGVIENDNFNPLEDVKKSKGMDPWNGIIPYVLGREHSISIYPIPAIDRINFLSKENIENISVFTLSGHLVESKTPHNKKTFFELKPGVYLVRILTETNVTLTKKVTIIN